MGKRLPRGFPHRLAFVPGWAGVFQIPKYIVRVDVDEPGKAGTHGWQVRYQKPSTFFSDAGQNRRGNPSTSLAAAKRYLASIYAGPRTLIRTTPTKRKTNPIQEPGLRLVYVQPKGRTVRHVYVEAVPPGRGMVPKRVYVGTDNTVTPARIEAGKAKARQIRLAMVTAHLRAKAETPCRRRAQT